MDKREKTFSFKSFFSKYMVYIAFVALLIVFSLTLSNVGNGFLDMGNVWNIVRPDSPNRNFSNRHDLRAVCGPDRFVGRNDGRTCITCDGGPRSVPWRCRWRYCRRCTRCFNRCGKRRAHCVGKHTAIYCDIRYADTHRRRIEDGFRIEVLPCNGYVL